MLAAWKLTQLYKLFLTSAELFLHERVAESLSSLLADFLTACAPAVPAFDHLKSDRFYGLFSAVLTQFTSISYGDALFANFIALLLRQAYPLHYRRLVWTELGDLYPLLQATALGQAREYLVPAEQDAKQLDLYVDGTPTSQRPPNNRIYFCKHISSRGLC